MAFIAMLPVQTKREVLRTSEVFKIVVDYFVVPSGSDETLVTLIASEEWVKHASTSLSMTVGWAQHDSRLRSA